MADGDPHPRSIATEQTHRHPQDLGTSHSTVLTHRLNLTSAQTRALLSSSTSAHRVLSFSTATLSATIQQVTWDIPRQRYVFGAPTTVSVSPQFLYIRWANMPEAGYSSAAEFERWVQTQRISDTAVTDFKLAFVNGALIAAAVEYDGAGECEEPLPPADDNCF